MMYIAHGQLPKLHGKSTNMETVMHYQHM